MTGPRYAVVDVFSEQPFSGNSLAVFVDAEGLDGAQMLALTQELRHFETTFVEHTDRPGHVRARVFDLFGELPFAGHPLIGAAAVLQRRAAAERSVWSMHLGERVVEVLCERTDDGCFGLLDQGAPQFLGVVSDRSALASAFGLQLDELVAELPLEVVSTGLRYLVVPVRGRAMEHANVTHDLTDLLVSHGAEFAVLLDPERPEIRHWNNDGVLEDVATGSAAGTVGGYLLRHGIVGSGELVTLQQGRFVGRPSTLFVRALATADGVGPTRVSAVSVGGSVSFVGDGRFEAIPLASTAR